MPHDKNGQVLAVGDEVIIRGKVKSIQMGEDYCNLTVESAEKRKPDGALETYSTNAAVVERVQPAAVAVEQSMDPIMRFFKFEHLPTHLAEVSRPFCELADQIQANLPRNAERTVALRKLLEAKDAAVRASLPEE